MTAVLLVILSTVVLGLPCALIAQPRARGGEIVGLSWLFGAGLVSAVLFALAFVQQLTLTAAVPSLLVVDAVLWLVWRKMESGPPDPLPADLLIGRPSSEQPPDTDAPRAWRPALLAALACDVTAAFTIAGYAFYTTLAPLWEWDFWAIWGLKARVFFEHGGIDWPYLQSRWNDFVHPDYPLLVPMQFDAVALVNGAWSDRWLGVLYVAWAIATMLVVRAAVRREEGRLAGSVATLAVVTVAASRYVGLAEGPLIAYGAAALLILRHALWPRTPVVDDAGERRRAHDAESRTNRDFVVGALLLGLAASCKNEGVALLVATAIALFVTTAGTLRDRVRATLRLWPAVAVVAPWMLCRAFAQLPTDLARGSVATRVIEHLEHARVLAQALWENRVDGPFWLVIAIAILITSRELRRERFLLTAAAVQLAFYLASYLVTPNEVEWHVGTSWPRLIYQITIPVTVAVLLALFRTVRGTNEVAT